MHSYKRTFLLLSIIFHASVFAEVSFQIDGVNGAAKDNINLFLQALTIPQNAANSTYIEQVEDSTREALRALGYYQVEMQVSVISEVEKQKVTLTISPGMQTHISQLHLQLTGEGKSDSQFQSLLANFPLKVADILNHGDYQTAKQDLQNLAQRRGYFDAHFDKALVEVTSLQNSAVVYLYFDTGIRYQFGELLFSKDFAAKKQIQSLQNFTQGDPFSAEKLSKFNADLNSTGYFKTVSIVPNIKTKEGREIALDVIAIMNPEDSFNIGGGYSTDLGVRGKFRWQRPWVNHYGHAVEANVAAAETKQEASLSYKIPLKNPLYDYFSIQTGYKRVAQNDTDTNQYLIAFNRHWRLENDWLRTLFIKYDYEYGTQGAQDFSTKLIIPGISFARNRSRGGINPSWGDKQLFSLEVSNKWWVSSADLIKMYGQIKFLRSYHGQQIIASAELGAIYSDSIYNVPSSMRFFTGGDQSVRGYGYESIAPSDSRGYLLGGRYLAVASLEYRYPLLDNWKIALFGDAGTATDDFSEQMATSAGAGVVWSSPIGPVRLYLAKPFTEPAKSLALHIMLGPEI